MTQDAENLEGSNLQQDPALPAPEFEEFEIGKQRVPWFLWMFFAFIITWASMSWIKFFGY